MSTSENVPTNPTTMIVCPTTHTDWDWIDTFEEYYETINTYGVKSILESAVDCFQILGHPYSQFKFSYAETGFLRRYLNANPGNLSTLERVKHRFCLLGGGITSPDNQVSHCEVFIRNYLTGHEYLRSVGLIENVFPVAWLPDDFGHDPQLPVLIEALGFKAIGLSRVPGSPQPTPCAASQPAAADLRANGVTFYWPANDGSKVLTQFMPGTYYGITGNGSDILNTTECMENFLTADVEGVNWPGGIVFATQGGDWQIPYSPGLQGAPGTDGNTYSWSGALDATVTSGSLTVTSRLGTFADYYHALMLTGVEIPSFTLYAENYWTGYFASRPQLKIDHYQAAQLLMGAEVLEAILTIYGGNTSQERIMLSDAIAAGWHLLVPSTHHDFVTGTSPDSTYQVSSPPATEIWDSAGQLPMSARAVALANDAMNLAMEQLAKATAPTLSTNEIPVVVFNQLGLDLPDTAIVEMADPSNGATDYQVLVGTTLGPVQRSSDGTLLFQVPGMRSMAYQTVYLVPMETVQTPTGSQPASGEFTFGYEKITLTVSQADSWAITRIVTGDGSRYVQPGGTYINQIGIWLDTGNIYQFGMEFAEDSSDPIQACNTRSFSFSSFLKGGTGTLLENGPIRWRFTGNLSDPNSRDTYTTQYDLILGEALVRITTAGAVKRSNVSVLTSFPMQTTAGDTGSILEYGTSYYWENRDPQYSWSGLTFRASHDFAQLAASSQEAVAAVYHNGIPAWTIDGTILRGCLLRNTPAGGRGASGYDTGYHTQHYTLDVYPQPAVSGYPLRTSLYTQTPLRTQVLLPGAGATMPDNAQLASVQQDNAVIRVGKLSVPSDAAPGLILRMQQSCMAPQDLEINLPFLPEDNHAQPEIVTALEVVPERQTAVTMSDTTASFFADRAVWTMKVPLETVITG